MQTERFLKEMGGSLSLLDEQEEAVEVPSMAPEELEQKVKKTIEEVEQFFAHFGLTSEAQEELFKMPIIQQNLDEVIAGVARERMELELEFGAPRNGWDPLPFEKSAETEKILKKLLKQTKTEKIEAIHVDEIFDRNAQEQIAAIQERLSAALEEVKNATHEQKKAMALPILPYVPKYEPLAEFTSTLVLPDLQEKRSIDADFDRHYSEQLEVVVSTKGPQIITGTHLLPQNSTDDGGISDGLQTQTEGVPEQSSGDLKVRAVELIANDIEKMRSRSRGETDRLSDSHIGDEVLSPVVAVDEVIQKVLRKVPTTRANGMVISALKSRIQLENKEKSSVITEPMDRDEQQMERLEINRFEGMTLPGLPFSGQVSSEIDDTHSGENKSKTLVAYRRQVGPHRFQL